MRALLSWVLSVLGLAAIPGAASTTKIRALSVPGEFEVQASGTAVRLATALSVQKKTPAGWVVVQTNLTLIERCERDPPPACVDLKAGATIHPVRWTGWSCSGQCPGHCKKNVYRGPGTFRIVGTSCDKTVEIDGESFDLPPSGAAEH
jgi:hypothetical protein